MKRWAQAMLIYAEENDGKLPTNRPKGPGPGIVGAITRQIRLSTLTFDENGNQIRFMYGITWVESLYPYVQKKGNKTGRDFNTWMKCPNALNVTYPVNDTTARMSYAFNYNLVEYWANLVRNPEKVMMLREMDRVVGSVLRPSVMSTGHIGTPPMNAFLTESDSNMTYPSQVIVNCKLHNNGSNIAFADGHVCYFDVKYYPSLFDSVTNYDPETQKWWNYVSNADPSLNKVIAVTP